MIFWDFSPTLMNVGGIAHIDECCHGKSIGNLCGGYIFI
jgi:hypothetical protein